MTKKNVWLSPLLTESLLNTAGLSPEVMAQFDKYKSKTKFNKASSAKPTDDIAIPDTGKSARALLDKTQDTTNFVPGDDEGGDEEGAQMVSNGDDEENGDGASSGSRTHDTFGRANSKSVKPNKIDKKYVNLNPETAFGPEVVTSFDFPNVSILDLTKHMQKLTGLNLILDKDIKGKISISSPTPITIGDAWKAYLQALSINGYSLVKSGAYYTIVNNLDIRYSPTTM